MIPAPNGPRVELRAINNPQFEKDGKTYEITRIRRRIGGEGADWEELNLSKLTADEINQFIQSAQKASNFINKIGGIPVAFKTAHSFTLHFKENEQKNEPFLLDKVTYKTKGGNEQAHTIEQDRFSKETRLKMSKKFHSLNITIKTVFHRTMEKKPPLDIEEKQPSPQQQTPVDPTKNPNYKPKIEVVD